MSIEIRIVRGDGSATDWRRVDRFVAALDPQPMGLKHLRERIMEHISEYRRPDWPEFDIEIRGGDE